MLALIPRGRAEQNNHMVLLLLADRESVLFQYPYQQMEGESFNDGETNTSNEIGDFLSAGLATFPKENSYNPILHPNGYLDFQVSSNRTKFSTKFIEQLQQISVKKLIKIEKRIDGPAVSCRKQCHRHEKVQVKGR